MATYYRSYELDVPLRIRIGHLEGHRDRLPFSQLVEDPSKSLSFLGSRTPTSLTVEVQIFSGGVPLTLPVCTSYKPPPPSFRPSPNKTYQWNEWIEVPVLISQLDVDSCALITVRGPSGKRNSAVYCGAVLPLFDKHDDTLKQGRQKLRSALDTDPRALLTRSSSSEMIPEASQDPELDRLELLMKQHQMGQISTVDWLDNLVFRRIESLASSTSALKDHYVFVELPLWDFDVIWHARTYSVAPPSAAISNTQQLSTSVALFKPGELGNVAATDEDEDVDEHYEDARLMAVYDPDFSRETPIEAKYRRLIRLSNFDRDMRPNAKVRDELERIIAFSPVHELTSDEKILLWKYRYYLTKRKNALTKFVKSVSWDDETEAAEVVEVLHMWVDIDVADALELLGPEIENAQVRAYAVDRLRTANDQDLELYLLQLVEALKFEPWSGSPAKSYLARFLANRAVLNPALGNFFYWYVDVQSKDRTHGAEIYQPIRNHYLASLPRKSSQAQQQAQQVQAEMGTAAPVELMTLKQVDHQAKLAERLVHISQVVKKSREPRPKRIDQMRAWIADPRHELIKFAPTRLPLDPSIVVVGTVPEECAVFKSSMLPLKITFKTNTGGKYAVIYKNGDDLRQDQLVMQIIQLMDQLLRKENLDLKLTPYRILATGDSDGLIQFIPNETLSSVLSKHHGILPFLRAHAADENEPLGVRSDVMDNYVRSTAGYAVITYLLGVGDRHLDNLLIDEEGHFFHIDFGYILGKDPKPFPPMIKLPMQLLDGFGGTNSENYTRFRSYCFTAFTTLRKSSNLILALFNLMSESTIPNIMVERDQAVHKVEERFLMELSEEEAILHFQNLINASVNAFLPVVMDKMHSFTQYWRP